MSGVSSSSSSHNTNGTGRTAQAAAALNRGNDLEQAGAFPEAIAAFEESAAIFGEMENDRGLAAALGSLGNCRWLMGEYPAAVEHFLRSLDHSRRAGDSLTVGRTLNNLGLIHWGMDDAATALDLLQQALELHRSNNSPTDEARTLGNIGAIHHARGEFDQSLELNLLSLAIHRELESSDGVGASLINIALAYSGRGEIERALECCAEAHRLLQNGESPGRAAEVLMCFGELHYTAGEHAEAERYYLEALDRFAQMGVRSQVEGLHEALARLYETTGNHARALEHYKKREEIRREVHGLEVQRAIDRLQNEGERFTQALLRRFPALTAAEVRVCELLRKGASSKEIGASLHIAPQTVDRHRHNIRRKLELPASTTLMTFLAGITE